MTDHAVLDPPAPTSTGEPATAACCASCAAKAQVAPEQLIYALGRLDVRFPSLGLEHEFRQREAASPRTAGTPTRGERVHGVLGGNPHLARRLCYVLSVASVPSYVVVPSSSDVLTSMVEAVRMISASDTWVLVVGRRVGQASPTTCAGLMVPVVAADQIYAFSLSGWADALAERAAPAMRAAKLKKEAFATLARELFDRVALSTENLGAMDTHRALNYLLVQHPGLFVAAAQRADSANLDRVEARPVLSAEPRRLIAVILTFLDRATGVPERLFTRVDVSEEWPFLAEGPEGASPALGLLPFIENPLSGLAY